MTNTVTGVLKKQWKICANPCHWGANCICLFAITGANFGPVHVAVATMASPAVDAAKTPREGEFAWPEAYHQVDVAQPTGASWAVGVTMAIAQLLATKTPAL